MSTLIRDFELKLKLLCLYILSLYGIRISLKPALKLFVAVFRRGADMWDKFTGRARFSQGV